MKKIVLAYSGGLDTSVAIPWLIDKGYAVIAVALASASPMPICQQFRPKPSKSVPSKAS